MSQKQSQQLYLMNPQQNPHMIGLTIKSNNTRQVINTNNQSPAKSANKKYRKKIAYFQRKSQAEKRKIIQKPWSKPMAAQHLAAIKIQSAIRRFLYKKRKAANSLSYSKQPIGNLKGKRSVLPQNKLSSSNKMVYQHKVSNNSEFQHYSANQKLRQKFFTSPFNVLHRSEEACWRNFCAALIQATYKMALTRRLFKYHRFAMYHIAAIQIQWAWRGFQERKKKIPAKTKETKAAEKLQRAWRAFTNVKIFKYYKDLINFKEKGDPAQLLKSVNPSEAGILDAASKCHIRFRLGGDKFPPLIYYKIFSHGSVIDINAFAPRDYVKIKKEKKKQTINIKYDKDPNDNHDGWYNRYENNGWRPISDKILTPYDAVEIRTANQPKKFHFDKMKRKELTAKEKRSKKLKWLRKLYKDAKNAEILQEQPDLLNQDKNAKQLLEQLYENPFDDKRFMQLNDGEFENEVNNLIEWCEDLDYEKYINNWHQLATSAYAGDNNNQKQTSNLLGNSQINSYDMKPDLLDGEMINNGGMTLNDDRYAAAFHQNQLQEEQFLKSNIDYENRLKEHIYQFEDKLGASNMSAGAKGTIQGNNSTNNGFIGGSQMGEIMQ